MKTSLLKSSLFVLFSFFLTACSFLAQDGTSFQQQDLAEVDHQMKIIYIDQQPLEVEIVSTSQSTQQGLSGRSEIGADGMLFLFPSSQQRQFWMKDMRFNIDIVWINNGVVIGLLENVPAPPLETDSMDLELYPSDEPVNMVLELPAGDTEKRKIVVGSLVRTDFIQQ